MPILGAMTLITASQVVLSSLSAGTKAWQLAQAVFTKASLSFAIFNSFSSIWLFSSVVLLPQLCMAMLPVAMTRAVSQRMMDFGDMDDWGVSCVSFTVGERFAMMNYCGGHSKPWGLLPVSLKK